MESISKYNTCNIAGLWEHPDAWGEPALRWIPCECPVIGVLKETSKARLIQLDSETAVWVPNKVIRRIANNVLYWLPLRGYTFGGKNGEFFVSLGVAYNKQGELV